jgi:hypothetical protein
MVVEVFGGEEDALFKELGDLGFVVVEGADEVEALIVAERFFVDEVFNDFEAAVVHGAELGDEVDVEAAAEGMGHEVSLDEAFAGDGVAPLAGAVAAVAGDDGDAEGGHDAGGMEVEEVAEVGSRLAEVDEGQFGLAEGIEVVFGPEGDELFREVEDEIGAGVGGGEVSVGFAGEHGGGRNIAGIRCDVAIGCPFDLSERSWL